MNMIQPPRRLPMPQLATIVCTLLISLFGISSCSTPLTPEQAFAENKSNIDLLIRLKEYSSARVELQKELMRLSLEESIPPELKEIQINSTALRWAYTYLPEIPKSDASVSSNDHRVVYALKTLDEFIAAYELPSGEITIARGSKLS